MNKIKIFGCVLIFLFACKSSDLIRKSMPVDEYEFVQANNLVQGFTKYKNAYTQVAWSFYDLRTEQGITVSAEIKDGEFIKAVFKKDGKILLELNEKRTVKIIQIGKDINPEVL